MDELIIKDARDFNNIKLSICLKILDVANKIGKDSKSDSICRLMALSKVVKGIKMEVG